MSRWAVVLVVLLVTACGTSSSDDGAEPATSSPSETASSSASSSRFAEPVDIGGGVMVNVKCTGSGTPTVILEAGDESGIDDWTQVQSSVSQQTRVCAYSRLGTGASDPATGCRQLADLLAVLDGWLGAAEVPGPYVVAGTSGGGYITAGFAYAHPTDVVGVVLLDTFEAINPATAPPELIAELACDHPSNVERRDYVAVEAEAWNGRHDLGPVPVTVITNDYSAAVNATPDELTNVEDQKGWLVLSPQAMQIVVDTGHDMPNTEPALVSDEILKIVETARDH